MLKCTVIYPHENFLFIISETQLWISYQLYILVLSIAGSPLEHIVPFIEAFPKLITVQYLNLIYYLERFHAGCEGLGQTSGQSTFLSSVTLSLTEDYLSAVHLIFRFKFRVDFLCSTETYMLTYLEWSLKCSL